MTVYGENTWHFLQSINFNESLAQQNIFSISLAYQCTSSTSSTLTVDVLNNSTAYEFSNTIE